MSGRRARWLARAAIISTFLLAIVLLLWIVSVGRPLVVRVERDEWDLGTTVGHSRSRVGIVDGSVVLWSEPKAEPIVSLKQVDWYYSLDRTFSRANNDGSTFFPLWLIVFVLLLLPAWQLFVWIRNRQSGSSRPRWTMIEFVSSLVAIAWGLIPCILLVLCVRSYPYFERIDFQVGDGDEGVQVNSSRGSIMFAWTFRGPKRTLAGKTLAFIRSTIPPDRGRLKDAAELRETMLDFAGFTIGSDAGSTWPMNVLILPYWFVLLAGGLVLWPIVRIARRPTLREKRIARGQCAACGYDLRGAGDRCPECGEPRASDLANAPVVTSPTI